jgi:Fur family ferric uptake transcriptional regulator
MADPKDNVSNKNAQPVSIIKEKSLELHRAGLRVTLPRKKILQIFEEHPDEHFSAEQVSDRLKSSDEEVGLATIYRVLSQFEKAGLLRRSNFEGGHAVYELDSGQHHDHLVCMGCGAIFEFVDVDIEKRQSQIAQKYDFEVHEHALTLFGFCRECRAKHVRGSR